MILYDVHTKMMHRNEHTTIVPKWTYNCV